MNKELCEIRKQKRATKARRNNQAKNVVIKLLVWASTRDRRFRTCNGFGGTGNSIAIDADSCSYTQITYTLLWNTIFFNVKYIHCLK